MTNVLRYLVGALLAIWLLHANGALEPYDPTPTSCTTTEKGTVP